MRERKFQEVEHLGYQHARNLTTNRNAKQTAYQADEYERTSEEKAKQRSQILRIILDNHDTSGVLKHIRFLGLPGRYWMFERELSNIDPQCKVTGFEKDFERFTNGIGYMPGSHLMMERRRRYFSKHKNVDIAQTRQAYFINGDLKSLTDDEQYQYSQIKGPHKKALVNRTAVWYDFTSPFSVNTYVSIYNLHNVLHKEYRSTICLTLQYGRDTLFNGQGEKARVEIVEKALPGFKPIDVWTYKGFKDTTMINICGVREADPSPDQ